MPSQPKWLVGLIILVIGPLLFGGCAPTNEPPVISSLTANQKSVSPSGSCQLECIVSDPDGDSLSYIWSASEGNVSGEGSVATWIAPHVPGAYTLTVEITDGRGGEATKQLTIGVAVNHPPVIDSLTTEWQMVRKATTSTIQCIASDPDGDELSYIWSVDGGNISGEGPIVTWVAPNAYGTYTVTVTVTDSRGGEASESISIQVCSCPGAAS